MRGPVPIVFEPYRIELVENGPCAAEQLRLGTLVGLHEAMDPVAARASDTEATPVSELETPLVAPPSLIRRRKSLLFVLFSSTTPL